jgi:hypothetical protein
MLSLTRSGNDGLHWPCPGRGRHRRRPLTDVRIEIRTTAACRAENRSPLLRALVAELPTAEAASGS